MSSKRSDTKHFENNVRLVYGFRSIGKGQAAAAPFSFVMIRPPPPIRFHDYNKRLLSAVEKVAGESMANAKREAIALNEGSSDLTVALDGSWQREDTRLYMVLLHPRA